MFCVESDFFGDDWRVFQTIPECLKFMKEESKKIATEQFEYLLKNGKKKESERDKWIEKETKRFMKENKDCVVEMPSNATVKITLEN